MSLVVHVILVLTLPGYAPVASHVCPWNPPNPYCPTRLWGWQSSQTCRASATVQGPKFNNVHLHSPVCKAVSVLYNSMLCTICTRLPCSLSCSGDLLLPLTQSMPSTNVQHVFNTWQHHSHLTQHPEAQHKHYRKVSGNSAMPMANLMPSNLVHASGLVKTSAGLASP